MADDDGTPDPDEWHPKTRKDYEDIMAGGIIRAAELEKAEKDNGGSGGSGGSDDNPPKPTRKNVNFLGGKRS